MDEFKLINDYFAPHAKSHEGAFGLTDDAAIFSPNNNYDIVVTKDAIVAGVHFFEHDKPDDIAYKALAVNVSDLASMGAKPLYYLMSILLPKDVDAHFMQAFSSGIGEFIQDFGGSLIGGDTVFHDGKLSISITAIGEVEKGKSLRKSGAKIGDKIYVTGNIGDSYLGLQILLGKLDIKSDYLLNKYYRPNPEVIMGISLIDIATSCTDISDGLIQDLTHICECSKAGAKINLNKIPLSKEALQTGVNIENLINGGDDYELLFTLPKTIKPPKNSYYIGDVVQGSGVLINHHRLKTMV